MNSYLGIISLIIVITMVIDGLIARYLYLNVLNLQNASFYKKISFYFLLAGLICIKIYLPAIFLHGSQVSFEIVLAYGSFLVTLSGIFIIIEFRKGRKT